jgi:hypothetical protein
MKHPKKSIKTLVKETNILFVKAKGKITTENSKKYLQESLIKCEKAYDM